MSLNLPQTSSCIFARCYDKTVNFKLLSYNNKFVLTCKPKSSIKIYISMIKCLSTLARGISGYQKKGLYSCLCSNGWLRCLNETVFRTISGQPAVLVYKCFKFLRSKVNWHSVFFKRIVDFDPRNWIFRKASVITTVCHLWRERHR